MQVDCRHRPRCRRRHAGLGISDLANLFGMVKFYKGARGKGIKPVIGADCWITANPADCDKPPGAADLQEPQGYGQLCGS